MTKAFSNFSAKITNKTFLILNLRIFTFARKFVFRETQGCLYPMLQWLFQIPAQKNSNKAFLALNLKIFIFARKFESADFNYNKSFFKSFKFFSLKIPKHDIIFLFTWNFLCEINLTYLLNSKFGTVVFYVSSNL